jgi:integrase
MPVVTLTDLSIRALKPIEGKQVIFSDRALKGFGVRVTGAGAMSYVLTFGKDRRRIKIGDVGIIKLADARAEAKRILAEQTLGKRTDRTETFDAALGKFLDNSEKQNRARTAADYRRLLTKHCKSLQGRRIADIEKRDITRIIDRLLDRPSEAYHFTVAVKVFFRWAVRRDIVQQNPCEALPTIKKPLPRSRVLSDTEIYKVWHAASEMGGYGTLIRCCIATGLRVGELRAFQPSWIVNQH